MFELPVPRNFAITCSDQVISSVSPSLHPGLLMGTGHLMPGVSLLWTSISRKGGGGGRGGNIPSHFMLLKPEICAGLMGHLAHTFLAKNFGRLIFGHFFPHFGQFSDKNFGHYAVTCLK